MPFPLGLELKNLQQISISAKKKTAFLLRLVQDPARSKWPPFTSFHERSNNGYAKKPKKPVKRQTDTKAQWNTLQVSRFYSFHLRMSYYFSVFLIRSLLYFQRSPLSYEWVLYHLYLCFIEELNSLWATNELCSNIHLQKYKPLKNNRNLNVEVTY